MNLGEFFGRKANSEGADILLEIFSASRSRNGNDFATSALTFCSIIRRKPYTWIFLDYLPTQSQCLAYITDILRRRP